MMEVTGIKNLNSSVQEALANKDKKLLKELYRQLRLGVYRETLIVLIEENKALKKACRELFKSKE